MMKDHPFERILRDGTTASIMPPNEDACLENIGLIEAGLDPKEVTPFLRGGALIANRQQNKMTVITLRYHQALWLMCGCLV
ncbi:hypothetical protein [Polycladomyces subterraneus]|uniref:Uncharacterized protein n=1 Tax=Polycladomyces subterraneus TaxID=1016997 RepID=A0ABT8IRL7_9BACL|nr:hypothetical protein [Polycladomyces subterraneus]MDN4595390.1 hypothetical protein [Polycladomyces subterraneus]